MLLADMLFAFVTMLLLTSVFIVGFRRKGPSTTLAFAVIVFLASWAGGVWARPFGPQLWGLYWMGFFWVGLLVSLLLASASASSELSRREIMSEIFEELPQVAGMGLILWMVIAGFAISIGVHYM